MALAVQQMRRETEAPKPLDMQQLQRKLHALQQELVPLTEPVKNPSDTTTSIETYPYDVTNVSCPEDAEICGTKVRLSDAPERFTRVVMHLAHCGRRGRKVASWRGNPPELKAVRAEIVTVPPDPRKFRSCANPDTAPPPPLGLERLSITYELADAVSHGHATQLAHALRESVGPVRKYVHIRIIPITPRASPRTSPSPQPATPWGSLEEPGEDPPPPPQPLPQRQLPLPTALPQQSLEAELPPLLPLAGTEDWV